MRVEGSATWPESVRDFKISSKISDFRTDFQVGNPSFAHAQLQKALPGVQRSTSTTARLMRMRNKINPPILAVIYGSFPDFAEVFPISTEISGEISASGGPLGEGLASETTRTRLSLARTRDSVRIRVNGRQGKPSGLSVSSIPFARGCGATPDYWRFYHCSLNR